jgi:glucose dehydrogenase
VTAGSDGREERIFWGTGDGYLLAVDAKTGMPVSSFGRLGRVDLMTGLPRAVRGTRDWLNQLTYSVQSPPVIVRDTIITPASISSYIKDKEQIPGYARGWDARTGQLRWTFHTVPRPGEFGNNTWEQDSWAYTGKVKKGSLRYIQGTGSFPRMPSGLPLLKPPYSRMTAIDMRSGERVWMVPLGNGDSVRNHPMLKHLSLPPLGGDSSQDSGPLLTKTLLMNALTAGGTRGGPRLVAFDKATGRELGSVDLPGTALGAPMTYLLDGRQYIVVGVSGDPVPGVVALALPKEG